MKCLPFIASLLATASLAAAQVTTAYQPTRDTYMRGAVNAPQLHGTSPSGRASKAFLDFYLADFDRAAIRMAIEAQLGRPLTPSMDDVELKWFLFSNNNQNYQPQSLSRPAVFQGTQDWTEGDATQGATKAFAHFEGIGEPNNRQWARRDGTPVSEFLNLDKVQNAVFEEWGGEVFTYRGWTLDDNVAYAYLTDPVSLGLFLNATDTGPGNDDVKYNNTEVHSKEGPVDRRPYLQVTVVPEPGAAGLLALGAIGLMRGRRKRADVDPDVRRAPTIHPDSGE
jgi:hypothetical protein